MPFNKKTDLDIETIANTHSLESIPENDSLRYNQYIAILVGFAIYLQYLMNAEKRLGADNIFGGMTDPHNKIRKPPPPPMPLPFR